MRLEFIIRRAKRYAETKRGPYGLRLYASDAIHVEVTDGEDVERGEMTFAELGRINKTDEAIARLCHIVDETIHRLRDIVRRRRP